MEAGTGIISGGSDRRRLASALRGLRLACDLSGDALAARLGWSQSKVSKIENGRTRPSLADVKAWAEATQAAADVKADLVDLATRVINQVHSWRAVHAIGLTQRQRDIAEIEAGSTLVQNFQPGILPGLLQTADYARRVLTMADIAGQRDVASAVAARLDRQSILFDQSKSFEFLLTEGVLRWRPGPPELMQAQLDRLLSIATLPNVTIGVVPFDIEAPVPYVNGFTIFHVPDDPVVLVEVLSTELLLADSTDLALYTQAYDRLAAVAANGANGESLIRAALPRQA